LWKRAFLSFNCDWVFESKGGGFEADEFRLNGIEVRRCQGPRVFTVDTSCGIAESDETVEWNVHIHTAVVLANVYRQVLGG
jgi:hypothetical protein